MAQAEETAGSQARALLESRLVGDKNTICSATFKVGVEIVLRLGFKVQGLGFRVQGLGLRFRV